MRATFLVYAPGRVVSRVDMRTTWAEPGDVLPRGELAAILRDALPDDVEIQFGSAWSATPRRVYRCSAMVRAWR